jgi:hypothetical protein
VAGLQRVGVHHPRHRLLVRAHVRRGDVDLRTDERNQLLRVAPRHALQFTDGKLTRIAGHAAFGSAIRQAGQSTFPAHPHRQRRHLAERHVMVKAHAALRRSEREMMLHAIAHEDRGAAIITPHRHRHAHAAFGHLQAVAGVFGDVQKVGHQIKLLAGHAENGRVIDLGNHVAHGEMNYAAGRIFATR